MSYKKCPIIFIDILGTKENSDFETQFKIQTMFHNALEKERGMDANHNYTVYKRFITTFSDCAYIVYDYKDEIDAHRKDDDRLFLIALYNTEKLIVEFLKEGFLCRGACTFGEVYYDNHKSSPISGNRMDTGRNHSLLHAPWSFYLLNKEIRQP